MREKIREFVEATLIIGAKRGNPLNLTHVSAKELIEQHVETMTDRFLELISKEVHNSLPTYEKLVESSQNVTDFWTRNGQDMTAWKHGFVVGASLLVKDIEDKLVNTTVCVDLTPDIVFDEGFITRIKEQMKLWYKLDLTDELVMEFLQNNPITSFDTVNREDFIDFIAKKVTGTHWPLNGDEELYKKEFFEKFEKEAINSGYIWKNTFK